MKKFLLYAGFAALALTGLVLIGLVVITFMTTRLENANQRLEVREEERSSIEDGWISAHGTNNVVTLHIQKVEYEGDNGVIEWFESEGGGGRAHFSIDDEGEISYFEEKSEFPKTVNSYPMYFRQTIEEAID